MSHKGHVEGVSYLAFDFFEVEDLESRAFADDVEPIVELEGHWVAYQGQHA